MENEHSELIIGYLQGRLHGRDLDNFYVWVNESADNKKLFFEPKALMKPVRHPVKNLKYKIAGFDFLKRERHASIKNNPSGCA